MAETTNNKKFLDEQGLAKAFELICENHYSKDEVDELIENIEVSSELPEGGTPGQVLTKTESGVAWKENLGGTSSVETMGDNDITEAFSSVYGV